MATAELTAETYLPEAEVRDAAQPFDDSRYLTLRNVPIFAEHETTARDGRKLRFTRNELEAIAERCNRRIRETGDYAAITLGHTPEPGSAAPDPPLVGAAGPFKVGLLGQPGQRKRYCILTDLHVFRDKADVLRTHPRRSPELWLEETYEEMFLDPIALLGAEAPRLDMGLLLYRAQREGKQVEKYAAAAPSASSVFVPSHEPKRYESQPNEGNAMALDEQSIRQIVDAIEQLDWVQFVKQQMAEQAEGGATPPAEPDGDEVPGAGPPPVEPPAAEAPSGDVPPTGPPVGPPPVDVAGPPAPPPGPPPGEAPKAPPGPPKPADEEKEKLCAMKPYAAATGDVDGKANEGQPATAEVENKAANPAAKPVEGDVDNGTGDAGGWEKYAKGEIAKLRGELDAERHKRVNAERYGRLSELRVHRAFDLDEEAAASTAEVMSDQQFERHYTTLERYCKEIPVFGRLPTATPEAAQAAALAPDRPGNGAMREHYNKSLSDRCLKYCIARRTAGDNTPDLYERTLEKLRRGEALPAD